MAVILRGHDKTFAKWAAARIPHVKTPEHFGDCVAVGIATGPNAADRLLAVTVFHDYFPQFSHCQISMAAADAHWATRTTIRSVLSVPFHEYGVNKVWVAVPHTSERVIRFVKAIGFTQEAVLKDHYGRGVHCVICRLLTGDYERLYGVSEMKAA